MSRQASFAGSQGRPVTTSGTLPPHCRLTQVYPPQQFRSSVQRPPLLRHRQRPLPSLVFRFVLQMFVQQSLSFVQTFAFFPLPHGAETVGLPLPRSLPWFASLPAATLPPSAAPSNPSTPDRRVIPAPSARATRSNDCPSIALSPSCPMSRDP